LTASHERLRISREGFTERRSWIVWCGVVVVVRSGDWEAWTGIGKAKRPRRLRDSSTHLRGRNAIAITTNFRACPLPRTAPIHPLPTTPVPAEASLARLPKRRWRRRFDIKMQCCTASGTELLATGVPTHVCWCVVGTFVCVVRCSVTVDSVETMVIGEEECSIDATEVRT
jgi:hypothetical protein